MTAKCNPVPIKVDENWWPTLQCAQETCELNALHPYCVRVNKNGLVTLVDSDATNTVQTGMLTGRGVEIDIDVYCECGCAYTVHLWFHKGATMIEMHNVSPFKFGVGGKPTPNTLWRD